MEDDQRFLCEDLEEGFHVSPNVEDVSCFSSFQLQSWKYDYWLNSRELNSTNSINTKEGIEFCYHPKIKIAIWSKLQN